MSIQNKIEEIRQKPEHIRLRYVWACTAVSMVFILAIWFISIWADQKKSQASRISEDQKKLFEDLSEEGKNLKDTAGTVGGLLKDPPAQIAPPDAKSAQNMQDMQNVQDSTQEQEGFTK